MVRRRSVRSAPPLANSALLVRALFEVYEHGAVFDRDVLVADVTYNFDEFGYHGLSLWLAQDPWPLARILAERRGGPAESRCSLPGPSPGRA
jgi:hypothetical protein